jgi:hypothetical protein
MGKTRYYHEEDDYDDEYQSYREDYKNHKHEKKLHRALKTKNIDDLLEYYDDEYDDKDRNR